MRPLFTEVSRFDQFTTERIWIKTFHWLSVHHCGVCHSHELFSGGQIMPVVSLLTLLPEKKAKIKKSFCSGIVNLLIDGFAYNTRGHLAHCYTTRKISACIICKTID